MKLFLFILFKVGFFILFWASFLGSKTWPVRCSFAIIVVVGCAYVHSNFPLPGTFYCQNMSFLKKRYSLEWILATFIKDIYYQISSWRKFIFPQRRPTATKPAKSRNLHINETFFWTLKCQSYVVSGGSKTPIPSITTHTYP